MFLYFWKRQVKNSNFAPLYLIYERQKPKKLNNMEKQKDGLLRSNGVSMLLPFILVTSCFALWGFANDITNPMVKAFSKIFRMSVTDGLSMADISPWHFLLRSSSDVSAIRLAC